MLPSPEHPGPAETAKSLNYRDKLVVEGELILDRPAMPFVPVSERLRIWQALYEVAGRTTPRPSRRTTCEKSVTASSLRNATNKSGLGGAIRLYE
ncbi:hypothetical protein EN41_05260 [Agrobacterium tumefaciens]|jgi:hypothetical protein|nr:MULTISPECIES: hypothetical protein [Agrobacterium tumefaciens complex]ASK40667.1 hypothetical protein [Agrobacterium genomosp. 6]ASK41431.1 hypothetical protein [Agrobacterium genomosp. 6]ASK42491.1 hypothetical protein [Agrobacterium sp.]KEY51600.1 hypothetical protein EN41_05260 [Agrobacterium tumefaciens]